MKDIHFKTPDNSLYIGFVIKGKNYAKHIKLDDETWHDQALGVLAHALDQVKRMK